MTQLRLSDDQLRNNRKVAKTGKRRKQLTFWTEVDDYVKIKKAALELDISTSRLCTEAIRIYLDEFYGE